ncbi:MAG: magnesium transporter [Eubacteriales bacterium]|nr:magnesium transporter [Eubacteriales bacterium]
MLNEELEAKLYEVRHLLEIKAYPQLQKFLAGEEPIDIAAIAEEMQEENLSLMFRILPKDLASDVFVHLSRDSQETLIDAYSDAELNVVLNGLFNDDLAEMLEELPASVAQRVLRQTDPARRQEVNRLLQYRERSAGSVMTTEYMRLEAKMTVAQAFHKLKSISTRIEMIYTCFVTDETRILQGVISVADLLRADDSDLVQNLMDDSPHFVYTEDEQEEAALIMQRYDLLALPVLDKEKRLVGIITIDDAMEVLREEATGIHSHMAAVRPNEEPYPDTSVWDNIKGRLPWLLILMISGSLNALILQRFEAVYLALPVLVTFMPMLTCTGGNAASQTSSVEIVAMSTGDIDFSDILKVVWKEIRVALLSGSAIAGMVGVIIYFSEGRNLRLTLSLVLSFLAVVVLAKVVASILPFLAKALKLDPAMVVAPLVTTLVDILGIAIYYWLAAWSFNISL